MSFGTDFRNDWQELLAAEMEQPYLIALRERLEAEYELGSVYPASSDIFNALDYTSYAGTKVVILGQDPYHGLGQAQGLSFSVNPGVRIPPSLQNIYKELHDDLGCPIPDHGNLIPWARQGVLLLNAVLTVQAGKANSHQGLGWERFTDRIVTALGAREKPVVFILWGKYAQAKAAFIDAGRHAVIASPHPSPFAARRGFFGSRPFSRANAHLRSFGSEEIEWCLPPFPKDMK
ncbi:uracil-DNA glycosylase [Paenibacillus darwinianus]|uniref:Uracil-DNA glycosylase n=1 Tax=Paenibacillus darwinianus TaxID=1380763 RepID=A0A9W5S0E2_9BACL|nr:uracil-DNA glycosylase [Paenibacillus darwinianus]EXX85574.1 uracil-DNA glycosylase [Paenibacillus darwinianus]EXX88312.1 uracil-DNA glycosylase [Paenibacillus darwinianus]EXX89845.1 uracil-DNA glycosylase [Paenibacillus darwinianus]